MSGNDVAPHVDLQSKHHHPWPMLVPDLLAHRRRPPRGVSSPQLQVRPLALLLLPGYRRTRFGLLPSGNGNPRAHLAQTTAGSPLPVGCRHWIENQPRRARDQYRLDQKLALVSRPQPRRRPYTRLSVAVYHWFLAQSAVLFPFQIPSRPSGALFKIRRTTEGQSSLPASSPYGRRFLLFGFSYFHFEQIFKKHAIVKQSRSQLLRACLAAAIAERDVVSDTIVPHDK
jgi:hypothetical protein